MLRQPLVEAAKRMSRRPLHTYNQLSSYSKSRSFGGRGIIEKSFRGSNGRPFAFAPLEASPRRRKRESCECSLNGQLGYNIMTASMPCMPIRPLVLASESLNQQMRHVSSMAERIRRSKRWNSSSNGGSKKSDGTQNSSGTTAETPSTGASPPSDTISRSSGAASSLSSIVQSVGPTLRKVTEWNMGDLASVFGIVLLILLIVVAPLVVEQMRKSDSTYGEQLDPDDSIALMDKVIREERLGHKIGEESGLRVTEDDPDRKAVDNTVNMAADVLNSEALQDAIVSLINRVLESTQFQSACQRLLKNLWDDLVNDPETTVQVVQLLNNAIQNKEIQRSVKRLVLQMVNDAEVYDELTRLLVRLGQDKQVLKATEALLGESAHNALNDPEILDHSMEFATDVVGDDIVQRTSGEALRNTVSYAVTPGLSIFLSILGVGLLVFSISAFGNSRASEHEAIVVDRAMTALAGSLQSGTKDTVRLLFSLPGRIIASCGSLLMSIVTLPLRLVQKLASRLERAGGSTTAFISSMLTSIVSWPCAIGNSAVASLSRLTQRLSDGFSLLMGNLSSTIGNSFVGSAVRSIQRTSGSVAAVLSECFVTLSEVGTRVITACGTVCYVVTDRCRAPWTKLLDSSIAFGNNVLAKCQAVLARTNPSFDRLETLLAAWSRSVAAHAESLATPIQKVAAKAIHELSISVSALLSWIAVRIPGRRQGGNPGGVDSSTTAI